MRNFALALLLAMLLLIIGCAPKEAPASSVPQQEARPVVYATLFPQYDFARQIAGDRIELILLLPPGVESHSFEPTPANIAGLSKSDLLLYTGPAMEPWVASLLQGELPDSVQVLNLSEGIALQEDHEGHDHPFDPHIWTSPLNAMKMADSITEALCVIDPEGATLYRERNAAYQKELSALHQTFSELVAQSSRREIAFGGRFALTYFAEEYGLQVVSPYDSCSEETEPSAKAVAEVIDQIKALQLPVIFHEELIEPQVARSIAAETGAELLLLHSCHNLSKDELSAGETYLSLMKQNAIHLQKGLLE